MSLAQSAGIFTWSLASRVEHVSFVVSAGCMRCGAPFPNCLKVRCKRFRLLQHFLAKENDISR